MNEREITPLIKHCQMRGAGVDLHVAVSGEGQPVVLLHGFPECWYAWHHQIPALVASGYKVLAPDLRGYNLSEKPQLISSYSIDYLVDDVAELLRSNGSSTRAHIVGHDWGGIIAWFFAWRYPHLIDKLVIMNAPHPAVFHDQVWKTNQWMKSWYVLLFSLPLVAEWRLSRDNFKLLRQMFKNSPWRTDAFSEGDIDVLIDAIAQPDALTSALNYYRCGVRDSNIRSQASSVRTDAQTLIIWGLQDIALGMQLLEGNEKYAPNLQVERIADAGHWVQNEAPTEVNTALIRFLSQI